MNRQMFWLAALLCIRNLQLTPPSSGEEAEVPCSGFLHPSVAYGEGTTCEVEGALRCSRGCANIIQMLELLLVFLAFFFFFFLRGPFFFFFWIVFPSDQIAAKKKGMVLELSRLKAAVGRSLFSSVLTTNFLADVGGGRGLELSALSGGVLFFFFFSFCE